MERSNPVLCMIIGIEDRVRFRQKLAANIGKRNRAGSADKEFCGLCSWTIPFLGANIFRIIINQNNTKKEEDFIEGRYRLLAAGGRAFRHSAIAPAASFASLSPVAACGVATIPNAGAVGGRTAIFGR